jgi:HK97 family phage portal protein
VSRLSKLFGVEERSVGWNSFSRDVSALMMGLSNTTAGETVTEESALKVSPVFGAVRVISEPIATLPIDTFVPDGDARKRYKRPLWMDYPNFARPELTKIALLQQIMWSLLLWGDAFIATYRDDAGRIIAVDVLDPDMVSLDRQEGKRIYWVGGVEDGIPLPTARPLSTYDVVHIPGYMLPGATRGLSVIKQAALETIGLAAAAQRFGAAFFGNGAHPGLVIEAPGPLSADAQRLLKANWNEMHSGAGNAHRLAVATEGAKFNKVTLSPNEAQFLETRQFSVQDIARFFGVPPHKLADSSNSTSWGSGLESQNLGFAQEVLRPWVERLEEGLTRLMLSDLGINRAAYVKLNMGAFSRGTQKERLETYQMGLEMGLYCIDDCRSLEDLPPLPDGLGAVFRALATVRPLAMLDTIPIASSASLSDDKPQPHAEDPASTTPNATNEGDPGNDPKDDAP